MTEKYLKDQKLLKYFIEIKNKFKIFTGTKNLFNLIIYPPHHIKQENVRTDIHRIK
jgi:hypothetical protein